MKTSVATTAPEKATAALLAVSVPELDGKLPAPLAAIDKALHGAMGRAMTAGDFTGKDDETALFYPADGPQRVLLVGLGTPDAVDAGAIRKAAAQAGRRATSTGAESIAVYSPPDVVQAVGAESVGQAVVEGAGQGGWTFEELRSERESRSDLAEVVVLGDDADREALERGRVVGDAIAHGQILARNLQMRPGNLCTPAQLAAEAEELGTRHGIAVGVMDLAAIDKEGMNALLAVAQGSAQEPRFITLEYKGDGGAPPVCLVGKGVTFDSGGISIKPALNMEEMKYDMSGAAAVLGAFEALGRLKPKLNVVGLIPAT
ncbi:MAG: leucyl aminopeptidase, partial [Gemmatimonadetes bacterium]|nr:leucyl aminopeptidase [Gemmatimonadota bacterium]